MSPACSIIVPVYDDRGYLADALASVVAQTRDDWECVVVDDGSATDAAAKAVADVGDARVRLVRHEVNRGLAAARNTGIRAARADLIVTLDADDELALGFLEAVLPALAPGRPHNCAFTDTETFGAVSGVVRRSVPSNLATLLRFQWLPGPGAAFRRELWEAAGGYAEDPALRAGNEDRDFWIAAFGAGLRPVHVPGALYRYRVGHTSMMAGLGPQTWRTHEAIVARHRELYDRHGHRRAFLADGYLASARAVRAEGRRRDAIRLALRALAAQPHRLVALGVIGRALLPGPLHRRLRSVRRRLADGRET
jgi:glycosyltransferase involved in cell wall biosynthesis